MRQAYSQQVNEFIKACDLGIEGAFVRDSVNVSGTVANLKTFVLADAEAKMHRVFETLGWRNVTICGTLRDA